MSELKGIDLNDTMYLTLADVRVTGAVNDSGKVNNYSKSTSHADNGNPIVDMDEAREWAQIFNGNPSYLKNENGFYGYEITGGGDKARNYTGYNLARVAEMSGGGGGPFQFRRTNSGETGNFVGVTTFVTTQRPDGQISTNKTQYNVGETVTVNASGKDHSIYNRGLKVINMYIYNVNTKETEYRFDDVVRSWPISGSAPTDGSGSGAQINFPTKTWIPTKEGNYEARILITDTHDRNTKNAPSVGGEGVAYSAPFTVGKPPGGGDGGGGTDPDPDPDPDPGPSCTIANTKMDFQIVGRNDVKDYNAVPSGGSSIMVEKNAEISLFASKDGTFTMNGVKMSPGSGNNRKRAIGDFGDAGNFKVVYESDDGRECWEQLFIVKSDSKEESCPIITILGSTYRSGQTVEVLPDRTVYFQANFNNSEGKSENANILWDVTTPDGRTYTLPAYNEEVGGRDRVVETPYYKLELPFNGAHKVTLERGKQYKIKLNFKGTNWKDRPECAWEITLVVKDTACTIAEQHKLELTVYSNPPHPFSPGGQPMTDSYPIYIQYFTSNSDGSYDTNLSFSANSPGTWYLNHNNKQVPLTAKLAANEKFDLILPSDFDVGDWVTLEFESEIGCIAQETFQIMSDRKCYNLSVGMIKYGTRGDYLWQKEVIRGETLYLTQNDFDPNYRPEFWTHGERSEFTLHWLDPETQQWSSRRNGKWLSTSNSFQSSHYFSLPSDDDSDEVLEGLYKIHFWTDSGKNANGPIIDCRGDFFLQIGASNGENLLIAKNSFTITPQDPQLPGTESTITFQVKNAGKTLHDTKLAVRWESSDKETVLDVNNFKPGETRKITVPTQYPQQSEDFIAHINPSRNKPENESIWTDNRATWPVKVLRVIEPPAPPGGGEDFDGGEIVLEIYDSDGRKLERPGLHVDGVWEREPAKIEVVIDQTKINEGFQRTQQGINAKIEEYKDQLTQFASGEGVKNIVVTAQPGWISDAKSMAVYTPAMLDLKVSGPGIPQQWQVSSSSRGGEYIYTGTTVPTQTTWRQTLNNQKYLAEINGFQIVMDYEIVFDLSFDRCKPNDEEGEESEETCEPSSLTRSMSGRYSITVTGGKRTFEVFEPNATGSIHHTAEWLEYHARDRYLQSQPHDFYAGERILTQVELQDRHRHPVSGKYPVLESATSWIYESGKRQTLLESRLSMIPIATNQWRGPNYQASKLGSREVGVDTPLMGDKHRGFQKDASYAVYFNIQFRFGVSKGYPYANKQQFTGHDQVDYRMPFRIIANAWERQGIRNHTTQ